MGKLLIKSFLLALLIIVSYAGLYIMPAGRSSYLSATIDKHHRLATATSPKIVFIGGSNLAFGLDSQLVEQQLGEPVINMGLAAGLGLRYMLGEATPYLRSGDTVVIVPEYEQFSPLMDGERDLADIVVINPKNILYLQSHQQYLNLLTNLPLHFQDKVYNYINDYTHQSRSVSEIYRRDGFNEFGDITTHLNQPAKNGWQSKFTRGLFNEKYDRGAIKVLNNFKLFGDSKRIQIILIFPCVPDSLLSMHDKQLIEQIYNDVRTHTLITVPKPPERFFYPVECFYDTQYHLTSACRQARTDQIIDDISQVLTNKGMHSSK